MLVVHVLGTVRAERDGAPVRIGSAKQRLLLALLAAQGGAISRSRLIDALWPDDPPDSAASTLMAYVSRLRAALGTGAVVSDRDAYRLAADRIDASELEAALRPSDASTASLERAVALWDGDAFGELAGHPFLLAEAARLHELRATARVRLAAAYLDEGDTVRPVSMLEAVVASDPLREDAWVLLVRALLRAGRAAEAAMAANRGCRRLAEVGLEPGPALVDAQQRALRVRLADVAPDGRPAPTVGAMRYARSAGAHLAFQVVGDGDVDVVLSSYGSVSIDSVWDSEHFRGFVQRLASSNRVVLYDTRGIGLSDPIDVGRPPALDDQADDLHAVMAAAGCSRAVVVGIGDGGPTAITFAHRRPTGLLGLVLVNTFARLIEAEDYPDGIPLALFEASLAMSVDPDSERDTRAVLLNHAPSVADDADFNAWWERAGRRGASPATATALWRVRYGADVRALLPGLSVPTLVMHRRQSRVVPHVFGRYLVDHVPGARWAVLPGRDQPPFTADREHVADLITAFAAEAAAAVAQ